jgi:glycosyltransferase involved in cell wall biosynthesis
VLVSNGRFEQFKRSFASFCAQDYPDKELVIVLDYGDDYDPRVKQYRQHIADSGRSDVRVVCVEKRAPLGALRNISVDGASGSLVCQWDEDDLSHPRRLTTQIGAMLTARAEVSFLADHFHWFDDSRQLYWSNWLRSGNHIGHPGTLLGYKAALPKYDERLRIQEDSALLRDIVGRRTHIALLCNVGHLYMYTYDGSNAFARKHHETLAKALGLEAATMRERLTLIKSVVEIYGITQPFSVLDNLGTTIIASGEPETSDEARTDSNYSMKIIVYK